jgi:hypothetical protein
MGLLYRSEFALLDEGAKKMKEPFDAASEREIKRFINRYLNLKVYVFAFPEKAGRVDAAVYARLMKSFVSTLGLGVELGGNRVLVLLPDSVDGELLSRHLFTHFNMGEVASFAAADSDFIKARLKIL